MLRDRITEPYTIRVNRPLSVLINPETDMVEIEIIGNIGREEEIQNIAREKSGANALRFSIAGQTGRGENQRTAWFTCFYSCDPSFKQYLHQGMKIFVRGEYKDSLYVNPKTNSTGIDRTISVHKLEFCDSKQNGAQPANTAPQAPVAASVAQKAAAPTTIQQPQVTQPESEDDKIPF